MSVFDNSEVMSKYQRSPSINPSLDDYTFNETFQLNNCEVEVIGTIHGSELSRELIEDRIMSDSFDCICLEVSKFTVEYYNKNKSFDDYIDNLLKKSNSLSTRYFLKSLEKSDLDLDIKEKLLGIKRNLDDNPPGIIKAFEISKKENISYKFIDKPRYVKDVIRFESKSFLLKLVFGFAIRRNIIKFQDSKEQQYESREKEKQRILSHFLCDNREFVFRNIQQSTDTELNKKRDKTMIRNIKKCSEENNKILVIIGVGHYENIISHLTTKR